MGAVAFGDHQGAIADWLDERAAPSEPCHRCGGERTLERSRANYAHGLPIHRHVIVACLDCNIWSVTCLAAVAQTR